MKRLILAAVLVFAPLGASAQTLRPAPAPLGPFALGMRPEAARAAASGAEWQVVHDEALQRGSMRTTGAAIEAHGGQFRAMLTFAADTVTLVRFSAELPLAQTDCAAQHRALVMAEGPRRDRLGARDYWYRFYENPDAPVGRMESGEFVPAPNFDARSVFQALSPPNVQNTYGVATFVAPQYNQAFFSAANWDTEITALSFLRAGAPVCRIVMQIASLGGDGGSRVSDGEGGAERLTARLEAAEFQRPLTYALTANPLNVARYYPEPAMIADVEGDVALNCLVLADGRLDCAVMSEPAIEYGFGVAALRIVRGHRVNVFEGDSAGKRTEFTIRFRLPH